MKQLLTLFVVLTAAAALAQTVDFDSQIQPIFDRECASCHGSFGSQGGLDLSTGASRDNLVGATSSGYPPAVRVAPGDLDASVLYDKLSDIGEFGDVMPPSGRIAGGD